MAKRYWGIDRGGHDTDVLEQSSTTSKGLEVVLDLTASIDKNELFILLEEIKNVILKDQWPPA